jgi:threonine aldolase
MQALASEETYKTTKTKIINWISNTTNYRVKWKKDSNYFAITYKDEEDKELKVNEAFYTSNFYDKTEEEETKDTTKYESVDKGLKTLDKTWEKLYNTIVDKSDRRKIQKKLEELLAIISAE